MSGELDPSPWLTAGGLGTFAILLFKVYLRNESGREDLIDRYRDDSVAKDAVIEAQRRAIEAREQEAHALRSLLMRYEVIYGPLTPPREGTIDATGD